MKGNMMIKRPVEQIYKGLTHAGVFHADDVFATALLKLLFPNIEIERSNDVPENYEGIVYDIGFGRYDHHQQDKEYREDGRAYAAFGLLWREYGECFLCAEDAAYFDKKFVAPLDNADNTGKRVQLSTIIGDFRPNDIDESGMDLAFDEAVSFAQGILVRRLHTINYQRECFRYVRGIAEKTDDRILYLEEFMPWKDALAKTHIDYVVYKSARGGYNIQNVPKLRDGKTVEALFPEEWRGRTQEELRSLTGIDDFIFCHSGGHICATGSYKSAKKVTELLIG